MGEGGQRGRKNYLMEQSCNLESSLLIRLNGVRKYIVHTDPPPSFTCKYYVYETIFNICFKYPNDFSLDSYSSPLLPANLFVRVSSPRIFPLIFFSVHFFLHYSSITLYVCYYSRTSFLTSVLPFSPTLGTRYENSDLSDTVSGLIVSQPLPPLPTCASCAPTYLSPFSLSRIYGIRLDRGLPLMISTKETLFPHRYSLHTLPANTHPLTPRVTSRPSNPSFHFVDNTLIPLRHPVSSPLPKHSTNPT